MPRQAALRLLLLVTPALAACAPEPAPKDDDMEGCGIELGSGEDDEAGGERFDVADGATSAASAAGDDGGRMGCQKVDVVLAIDNSSSMSEEIEALRGPVLDAFPEALLSVNGGIEDFQLGVIDACPKPAYLHDRGSAGACAYSTGTNFMSSNSPDLAAEFSCVTQLAAEGSSLGADECVDDGDLNDDNEQAALTAARVASAAAAQAANGGFMRDDALLFVVAVTDEDEALVDADAVQDIYDELVAAKQGDIARISFLGVGGGSSCEGPYGSAEDAVNLRELTQMFIDDERGMFWDICEGSLEEAFITAIAEIVDPACELLPPVG
jgi:hypothetical protein